MLLVQCCSWRLALSSCTNGIENYAELRQVGSSEFVRSFCYNLACRLLAVNAGNRRLISADETTRMAGTCSSIMD